MCALEVLRELERLKDDLRIKCGAGNAAANREASPRRGELWTRARGTAPRIHEVVQARMRYRARVPDAPREQKSGVILRLRENGRVDSRTRATFESIRVGGGRNARGMVGRGSARGDWISLGRSAHGQGVGHGLRPVWARSAAPLGSGSGARRSLAR
jgi:hypothetical protein